MLPFVALALNTFVHWCHHAAMIQLTHLFLNCFQAIIPKGSQASFQGHLWCLQDLTRTFCSHNDAAFTVNDKVFSHVAMVVVLILITTQVDLPPELFSSSGGASGSSAMASVLVGTHLSHPLRFLLQHPLLGFLVQSLVRSLLEFPEKQAHHVLHLDSPPPPPPPPPPVISSGGLSGGCSTSAGGCVSA